MITNEDVLRNLYRLAKDQTGITLEAYEEFLEYHFNGTLPPHLNDGLDKAKSEDDFVKQVQNLEQKKDSCY